MSISIISEGRRHYITGDTYAIRERLRSAGCKWDADRKAWWTGKREVAEKFSGRFSASSESASKTSAAPASDRPVEALTDDSKVIGRARYKGREYLLVWEGETRRGRAAKLAFSDGSKVFWAEASEVSVTKRYETREWRGREQPMTFGRLRRLREEYASQKAVAAKNDGVIGEKGAYRAMYEGSRSDRSPGDKLGSACWIQHKGQRLAAVLVGYEPATYARSEDLEDMGHYGESSGWYGVAHYRAATPEEYEALQATSFRADGVCVGLEVEPPVVADKKEAVKAAAAQEAARKAMIGWVVGLVRRAEYAVLDGRVSVGPDAWEFALRSSLAGGERLYVTADAIYYVESSYDDGPRWWRRPISPADVALVCELMAALTSCVAHADCRAYPELAAACKEAA